jgi:hypothetical protein
MGLLSTQEVNIVDQNMNLDLFLDERGDHAKFGCIGSNGIQIHNEQTFFFVYIEDLKLKCYMKTRDSRNFAVMTLAVDF